MTKKYTADQLTEGIDLEQFIGKSATFFVTHNPTEERTYANVESVMPSIYPVSIALIVSISYLMIYLKSKEIVNIWKRWEILGSGLVSLPDGAVIEGELILVRKDSHFAQLKLQEKTA